MTVFQEPGRTVGFATTIEDEERVGAVPKVEFDEETNAQVASRVASHPKEFSVPQDGVLLRNGAPVVLSPEGASDKRRVRQFLASADGSVTLVQLVRVVKLLVRTLLKRLL